MEDRRTSVRALLPEFEKYLQPSEILDHLPSLDETVREEIRELESSSRRAAACKLVQTVLNSDDTVLACFISSLEQIGYERFFGDIHDNAKEGDTVADLSTQYYEFLIRCMKGELVGLIVPSDIIPILQSPTGGCLLEDEDLEVIRAYETSKGHREACREMFTRIPRRKKDWAFKFFKALESSEYKHLIRKMDPSFSSEESGDMALGLEKTDDSLHTTVKTNEHDDDAAAVVKQIDECIGGEQLSLSQSVMGLNITGNTGMTASRPHEEEDMLFSDDEDEKQDSEESEKVQVDMNETPELHLRGYQLELAEHAIKGGNAIICSGTGTGKTRVALHIIMSHLHSRPKGQTKVVFLARTVPLVIQQYKALERYIPTEFQVKKITGENEESLYLHSILSVYDVFILTPQVLENHLMDGRIESLSVFTLMIFDECHHTHKGEPYNSLMKRFIRTKYESRSTPLPQIVGLTASLGVSKACRDEDAIDNILRVCANMDVLKISTVNDSKNKEELKHYAAIPEESRKAMVERRNDPVKKIIEANMEKIEDMIFDSQAYFLSPDLRAVVNKVPAKDRSSQQYLQWTVQLLKSAMKELPNHPQHTRDVTTCAEHLRTYNEGLEVNELVRTTDVANFLFKKFENEFNPDSQDTQTQTDVDLFGLFEGLRKTLTKHRNVENPNLTLLLEILSGTDEEPRFIVFVRTRATAEALANFLDESPNLTCSHFTGAGATAQVGGMTQGEQDNIIAKVKQGKLNGIVATSVAEEGLDIPECNIVLRYDHVGNEITTVQTRGRSRKHGGKSVLLATRKVWEREVINLSRADMMYRAIEKINNTPIGKIKEKIESFQKEALKDEDINNLVRQKKISHKKTGEFHLVCGRCRAYAVDSASIRSVHKQHHVVIDRDFYTKVKEIPPKKAPKVIDDITLSSDLNCKQCRHFWAVVGSYKKVKFPMLKLANFVLIEEKTKKQETYKKWIDVPFTITEIDLEDFDAVLNQENEGTICEEADQAASAV